MLKAKKLLFGDGDSRVQLDRENDGVEVSDPVKKMRVTEVRRRLKGVPIECVCGVAISLENSQSPNSQGERVFRCGYDAYGGGEGCGFRMWWGDSVLEEFEKIEEEKHELQEQLAEANKRIYKQEGKIYELQMQYEEMMADRKQLEDYDGELCGTQLGLAEMRDKHTNLKGRFSMLETKYKSLNKSLYG